LTSRFAQIWPDHEQHGVQQAEQQRDGLLLLLRDAQRERAALDHKQTNNH